MATSRLARSGYPLAEPTLMSGVTGASRRSIVGSPPCTAIVSECGIRVSLPQVARIDRARPSEAALFGHGLTLEETHSAAAAKALRAPLADDADAPVVFQHGEPDVAHLVEAVLADGHLDVVDAQALFLEILLHEVAVVDQHRRRRLDQAVEGRPAAAQHRDPSVEDEQGGDDDHPARDGAIRSGHRRLERVGDQQHQHQVKGRELPQLALAEQPETDEEDHIDEGGANDEMPPRNTQVEEFAEITHVSPLPSHRMPEPEVQQGGGVGEMLRAA